MPYTTEVHRNGALDWSWALIVKNRLFIGATRTERGAYREINRYVRCLPKELA